MEKETRNRLIRATGLYIFVVAILAILSFASTITIGDVASFLTIYTQKIWLQLASM